MTETQQNNKRELFSVLDRLISCRFYGKVEITFENGIPLIAKETRTSVLGKTKQTNK